MELKKRRHGSKVSAYPQGMRWIKEWGQITKGWCVKVVRVWDGSENVRKTGKGEYWISSGWWKIGVEQDVKNEVQMPVKVQERKWWLAEQGWGTAGWE